MLARTKTYCLLLATLFILLSACSAPPITEEPLLKDPFFGVKADATPRLLAPSLLASPAQEYNGTFSPDGKEFYYTTDIAEQALIAFTQLGPDNTWSAPRVASFSGTHPEYDPLFSPDGSKLFFSSKRPIDGNTRSRIWFVERVGNEWSEAQVVELTQSGQDEYYSSITKAGTIYFNIWSNGNLYKAQKTDTSYVVEELPAPLKVASGQGDPFVSPNEDYLIFRGFGEDTFGRGDLYISFNINDQWTAPENLGEPINSTADDICPYVTPDGQLFIFASTRMKEKLKISPLAPIAEAHKKFQSTDNGEMNIYYMSTDFISEMRQKHLQ